MSTRLCQSAAVTDVVVVGGGTGCGGGATAVSDSVAALEVLNKLVIGDNMENMVRKFAVNEECDAGLNNEKVDLKEVWEGGGWKRLVGALCSPPQSAASGARLGPPP